MKKRNIVKKIGCCLLVGSMAIQGVNTENIHILADSVLDIETPNYWSGTIGSYYSGGVQWEYLKLHYNGPTYGSDIYEEYITNMKVVSVDEKVINIIIPDKINNCKVKGLGENALKDLKKVKSVKIPKTIERICNGAFQGCSLLTDVQFEDITTLKTVGEYVFKDCTSFADSVMAEQMITLGKIQKGMFENCTSLEKINIEGENVKIADYAFSGCFNLKDIIISDKVENLEIGNYSFQNMNLREIEFPCKVKIGEYAFQENYYLNKVIFQKDADVGKFSFKNSFSNDFSADEKVIEFNSGIVNIGQQAFENCTGIKKIIFGDEIINTNVAYKAFWETAVTSLNFKGKNVNIQDAGLAGMKHLSELIFHNTSTKFEEEPFYGRYFACFQSTNSNLKKIIFDCETVYYNGDKDKNGAYTNNYGAFYGLTNLKEVVCEQKCKIFECTLRDADNEPEANCNKLDTFYFKNVSVNLDNFIDERKNKQTVLYGYQDTTGDYVNHIKNNSYLQTVRNQEIYYKSISSGLSVIYNGEDIVEGNEINTDNLEVYETYKDGTKSDKIPCKNVNNENGYEYTHAAYQLNDKEFLNVVYTITYGDSNCSLPVRIIKKKVDHFDIAYVGEEKIEGQTISKNDFVISNISYNDQSVVKYTDDEFSVELAGEDRLKEGSNTIQVTYKGKTIPYTLTAKKKKIQKLDIVSSDSSKKLFEGGILSKKDFIVTARYDNGDVEENYADYSLQNFIVERDVTNVVFVCGDYTQNYLYYGIPLKVDHLNVSYNNSGVEENGIIDKNDLKVTAVYNSGKEVVLAQEEYSFKTYTIIGGKENTIFVIYNGDAEVPEVPFNVTGIKNENNEGKATAYPNITLPEISETPSLTQTAIPEVSESPVPIPTQSIVPEISESSTFIPIQSTMPEISESPISIPTQTAMPEITESPVSIPIQSAAPEISESLVPIPTQSTIPEIEQSPIPTQSVELEPGVTSIPEQNLNTNDIPNGKVLILKKTKYKVGVNERIKLQFTQGSAKTFRSNNEKIATVNKKGVVTAKKSGTAKITIKDEQNNKITCTIIVKKAPKVVLASYVKKTMKVNQKITIKPKFKKGYYSNKITYQSSNTKVAKVSSKGIVVARKKGKAVITLKTYNNKKAKVLIYVKK